MAQSKINYFYDGDMKVHLKKSESFQAFKFEGILPMAKFSETGSEMVSLHNGVYVKKASNTEPPTSGVGATQEVETNELTVFEADDKTPLILTNEFAVRFKPEVGQEEIDKLNKENGVEIVSLNTWAPNSFVVRVMDANNQAVLRMANEYHQKDIVEYAQPNFVRLIKPFSVPNDPYFSKQWALSNTGQNGGVAGEDIEILNAWNISKGSQDITIAIVDEGVDYTHEDLNTGNKLVRGYSAINKKYDPSPNPSDAHGTCCAGIAAAASDNGVGICGVAPDCKLMGIKIAYGVIISGISYWDTTDSIIADGITKAVQLGADVLSNSWGGGPNSTTITEAINYAKKYGRSGKGCVVCFASGNDNSDVIYPGTLSNVITVAAVNEYGERKSPTSKDGEDWGSNYGPEVDVAAPGVHICTTDIMNSNGYAAGNYFSTFNGTSSATPHVAGLAALILSVNPELTATDVEYIIKNSTDDIGSSGYDYYTGYGRINAYKALRLTQETL